VAEVKYSAASISDLEQIGDYIAETLKNPVAALNTVNKICETIDTLNLFPLIGAELSSITEIDTDYRFLISGNYIVFYRIQTDCVNIDRVLYGKRDYISILFGSLL